jgi:hypothetical protein
MTSHAAQHDLKRLLMLEFFIGQCLLLIALIGLVTEGIDPSITLKLLIAWIFVGTLRPKWLGWMPRKWGKWVGVSIILFLVVDLSFNFSNPIDPLLRLGYLIFLSRNLSYRTNRESMQLILLSLFIIILCGVLSVSIGYLVQLLLFLPLALILLAIGSLRTYRESDVLSDQDWDHFRLTQFVAEVWRSITLKHVAALMLILGFLTARCRGHFYDSSTHAAAPDHSQHNNRWYG